MPLQKISFSDAAVQANIVSVDVLSSSNFYFDGLDYYLNSSINGVQYLSKLILKESLPFYNFVYSSNTTQQIQNTNILNYLVVDTTVDTFSATFNSFTLGLSNIFVSSNFNSCRLRVNLGPGLSCNKTDIFVTTDAVLSSNTNQFFTFSYFTTGSLLLGFALSGITPQTTPSVPGFPTPTPSITPSITPTITTTSGLSPTPTPTPTITPTISLTPTQTPTTTRTPTVTPSITPTISITPSMTPTPTVTPSAAAPSGIEVATTASVDVTGFTGGNTTYNGTYTKGTSVGGDPSITTPPTDGEVYIKGINAFVLLPPSVTIGGDNSYDGDNYPYSFEPQGNWTISRIDSYEDTTNLTVIASNPSSNNDYIPTAGWSPAITITAA